MITAFNSKRDNEKVASEVHVLGPFMALLAEDGSEMHKDNNSRAQPVCP